MLKYKIRELTSYDLTEVLILQKTIVDHLTNKTYFIPNDFTFFTNILTNRETIFLGVFDNDKLIAYTLVILDCTDYTKYFKELSLCPSKNCANFDIIVVHPNYRRQGIHKYFLGLVAEKFLKYGIQEVYCTVHPNNKKSLNNFLKNGYIIVEKITKSNNYSRFLLFKNLKY